MQLIYNKDSESDNYRSTESVQNQGGINGSHVIDAFSIRLYELYYHMMTLPQVKNSGSKIVPLSDLGSRKQRSGMNFYIITSEYNTPRYAV